MKVTLTDHSVNGQATIAQAAGVCYGKKDKDVTRITRLKQHKHLATMRFAFAVICIEDISIACQNQLVRSKHLDFLVESKRYVDASTRGFVLPDVGEVASAILEETAKNTMKVYTQLLKGGVSKEDARAILPANTMTSMYVAGNLQAWMDMLKLRVSKHAQKEVREVAIECWKELTSIYPLVFEDLEFEDKTLDEWVVTLT